MDWKREAATRPLQRVLLAAIRTVRRSGFGRHASKNPDKQPSVANGYTPALLEKERLHRFLLQAYERLRCPAYAPSGIASHMIVIGNHRLGMLV